MNVRLGDWGKRRLGDWENKRLGDKKPIKNAGLTGKG
jgi:hypothetical protein